MIGLSFDIVDNDGHKSEYPSCVVSIIPRHSSIKTENETTIPLSSKVDPYQTKISHGFEKNYLRTPGMSLSRRK
jgi:hypothetical protein